MIFITGGNGQGKLTFAKKLMLEKGERQILPQHHLYLRTRMQEGAEEELLLQEAKAFSLHYPDAIIIMDEVGCGVVPMDAFDRKWREVCGRVSVVLAEQAEEVYRVLCGIPQRLK